MRDCANCFHRKPVLKEDGTWTAECEKWDCEFQSRENMIEKTKAVDNDLISRECIRKALNEAFGCENATKYGNENAEQQAKSYSTLMLYEIANIVEDVCDNASTVEPDKTQLSVAYLKGRLQGQNERSQGEWIEGENGTIKCNQCGCEIRYSYLIGGNPDFPKFCCDCGAKMKKGGAENDRF